METNKIDYFVEPVEIEVYLKKAGKVRTVIRDLKIELIDVQPVSEKSKEIFSLFKNMNEPIDLMEVQNNFPELFKIIYDSYYQHMDLYEKLSITFKEGLEGSVQAWRSALYFTELLLKYEPTVASAKYVGDFHTYNLNYIIKKLNYFGEQYTLEDGTVIYLIKRHKKAHENDTPDREFNKLVELWEYNIKERDT
jgi:hypothetical protein